jgi:hypothetical protein
VSTVARPTGGAGRGLLSLWGALGIARRLRKLRAARRVLPSKGLVAAAALQLEAEAERTDAFARGVARRWAGA